MPRKIQNHILLQVKMPPITYRELEFVARQRGWTIKRKGKMEPNLALSVRRMIEEEAARVRKSRTSE